MWTSKRGCTLQVSLHLSVPEVVVHPSANEIKKALARTARSLVESAKSFRRWMDGTCVETPDLPGEPVQHCMYATQQVAKKSWHVLHALVCSRCCLCVSRRCVSTLPRQDLDTCPCLFVVM